MLRWTTVLVVFAVSCSSKPTPPAKKDSSSPAEASITRARGGFLKGQTHVHTDRSGDSNTPPAEVASFYARHGFDFIVLTDHNVVTVPPEQPGLLIFRGSELTQNFQRCDPPSASGCLLHINALMLTRGEDGAISFPVPTDFDRLAIYERAIKETSRRGGIAQINHPNMGWALDAAGLAELRNRGALLVEIANQNETESNRGDSEHPSTLAMWDDALSRGARIWGVATDDAHHYGDAAALRARGQPAFVGNLGWIMVRAEPTAASIRAALIRGDFYSSTGPTLTRLVSRNGAIEIDIDDDGTGPHTTTFIGLGGETLATKTGSSVAFRLAPGAKGYVRAQITSRAGKSAWTQPTFLSE